MHGPDVVFYAQSATESAQLLLIAGLRSRGDGVRVHPIRDLGWPVNLLGLAIGALRQAGSSLPIYFSGFEKGYYNTIRPELFDPATAGGVTPLFNKFEAAAAGQSSPTTDVFTLDIDPNPPLDEAMGALERTCARTEDPRPIRIALDDVARSLQDASHEAMPNVTG